MIERASQLLEEFIKVESRKLAGFEMPHMPTLGSAYEEITKQGIDKDFVIPKFLNIKIVSGFIRVGKEMLPEQIDCMLVHGNGEKYGLTDQYIYDIYEVLCIFEVKKTLRKSDYTDAFEHLASIRRKFSDNFEYKLRNEAYEPDISAARKHFSLITGKVAPERYLDIHKLSKSDGLIFYTLVQESLAPVSIIHGYDGYKTEKGLRSVFVDILEEKKNKGESLIGVTSLPTLTTSNQFCVVKGNCIPFVPIKNKNELVVVFSTRHNPAKMILELIWSKISIYFDVKMPWHDGLHMDNLRPLLTAEAMEYEGRSGWGYRALDLKEKDLKRTNYKSWTPAFLGKAEMAAINIMMSNGGYLPLDRDMEDFLRNEYAVSLETVASNLTQSSVFMKDGWYITPITSKTYILATDDGSGFASHERDKFDLWCKREAIEPLYTNFIFLG